MIGALMMCDWGSKGGKKQLQSQQLKLWHPAVPERVTRRAVSNEGQSHDNLFPFLLCRTRTGNKPAVWQRTSARKEEEAVAEMKPLRRVVFQMRCEKKRQTPQWLRRAETESRLIHQLPVVRGQNVSGDL